MFVLNSGGSLFNLFDLFFQERDIELSLNKNYLIALSARKHKIVCFGVPS